MPCWPGATRYGHGARARAAGNSRKAAAACWGLAFSAYAKGRAFEYRIKAVLERHGFYVVRGYLSHGTADLVAVPPIGPNLQALLIQAKYSNRIPGRPERARMWALHRASAGIVILVYKDKTRVMVKQMNGQKMPLRAYLAKYYGAENTPKSRARTAGRADG